MAPPVPKARVCTRCGAPVIAVLGIAEAAAFIGVSRRTMERIAATDVLPIVEYGDKRRRFRVVDLDDYVHAHTTPCESA